MSILVAGLLLTALLIHCGFQSRKRCVLCICSFNEERCPWDTFLSPILTGLEVNVVKINILSAFVQIYSWLYFLHPTHESYMCRIVLPGILFYLWMSNLAIYSARQTLYILLPMECHVRL